MWLSETMLGLQQTRWPREAAGSLGYRTRTASPAGARPWQAPHARGAPGLLASLVPWVVAMHVGVSLLGFCPVVQARAAPQGLWIDVLYPAHMDQAAQGSPPGTGNSRSVARPSINFRREGERAEVDRA